MLRCILLLVGLIAGASLGGLAAADTMDAASEPAAIRQQRIQLADMGPNGVAELTGVKPAADLPFGIPLDSVVVRAHLRLYLTASPSLIEQLSHLKILLNEQVVAAIPLQKADGGHEVVRDLELDPLQFTDYNHLQLQFIGHYAMECEDPAHSSLWLSIGPQSRLEMELRPLGMKGDLALLPAPFFDRRSSAGLELPFVFAATPSLQTVRAAGALASWFGLQAGYRGARFPVLLNQLPQRHAVVFATNAEIPGVLNLTPVQGPTLSVVDHPTDPTIKLLVVQGRDAADLQTAVGALLLGQPGLSGSSASVTQVDLGQRRAAYDAPNWVSSDHPVKLGDLVDDPAQLQVRGHTPDPIRINLRTAPDLLPWYRAGVPIELKYRYTPPLEDDDSRLNLSLNNQFVRALRLNRSHEDIGAASHLIVPLLSGGSGLGKDQVLIPAFEVGTDNQAQFQFIAGYVSEQRCKNLPDESLLSSVDPDSTVDFSGFPHYAAMPNLALFANSGFPFTKYADLAETVVVIPDHPAAADIEATLFVLGRMGRITGVPALRYRLVGDSEAANSGDADLLLIGAGREHDSLASWGKNLSLMLDPGHRRLRELTPPPNHPGNVPRPQPDPVAVPWQVTVQSNGPLAAILGFQSPLHPGRSVVAIAATSPEQQAAAVDALEQPALSSRIRGDTVLIRGRQVDSFQGEETYYVGHLSLWQHLWFYLSRHLLLLTVLCILAALLFVVWGYRALKQVAARRAGQ